MSDDEERGQGVVGRGREGKRGERERGVVGEAGWRRVMPPSMWTTVGTDL